MYAYLRPLMKAPNKINWNARTLQGQRVPSTANRLDTEL